MLGRTFSKFVDHHSVTWTSNNHSCDTAISADTFTAVSWPFANNHSNAGLFKLTVTLFSSSFFNVNLLISRAMDHADVVDYESGRNVLKQKPLWRFNKAH